MVQAKRRPIVHNYLALISISFPFPLSLLINHHLYINMLIRIKILHQNYNKICNIKFVTLILLVYDPPDIFQRKNVESVNMMVSVIVEFVFLSFVLLIQGILM